MDKINYNQHDWSKGEVIKEENLDNMENGIKQATDKINEIIDTEQDFRDRMTDIDGRIDINNEELVIARDGCDNLGQRIERDQQYIYNILNDGSYLEFNGTDITVDNSKEGYTSNMLIKGQTYQNLVKNESQPIITGPVEGSKITDMGEYYEVLFKQGQSFPQTVSFLQFHKNLKDNTVYTVIYQRYSNDDLILIRDNDNNKNLSQGKTNALKFTTLTNGGNYTFYVSREGAVTQTDITMKRRKKYMILEGDWTNKEVPSEITGIESVGEKEDNKISILSKNKNLCPINKISIKQPRYVITKTPIKLKPNTYYSISSNAQLNVLATNTLIDSVPVEWNQDDLFSRIVAGNKGYEYGTSEQGQGSFLNKDWKYAYITTWIKNDNGVDVENLMFCEGQNDFDFVPYKEDKKEILLSLDSGLKSLPDGTCDTIEQREDGVYLVQRVGKYTWTGAESFSLDDASDNSGDYVTYHNRGLLVTRFYICNKFIRKDFRDFYSDDSKNMECTSDGDGYPRFYIRMLKSKLNENTVSGFKQWLQANPVTVYYKFDTPVETKLSIDTLNLETFKDKTYILSENSIKPEIVCKAPVDVNQTIADLQEEQEQLMETYNTLKAQNEEVEMAISELNEQGDVQTADMLDLDMRVLALEEGL